MERMDRTQGEEGRKPNADTRSQLPARLFVLAVGAGAVVLSGLTFVHAPRLGWTLGWIYLGIVGATLAVNLVCLLLWNPGLIWRRARLGKGTKTWDLVWSALFLPLVIALYAVPVLEVRGTEPAAPGAGWLLGIAIFLPAWALIIWSMVVNPFFEKTVRIQEEHGHRVIDTGPYAYVRHPGYVGFTGWILSAPLMLGSVWGLVPALLGVVALVVRTALEDRTLQAELQGYLEYAARVQFRLIPGIW